MALQHTVIFVSCWLYGLSQRAYRLVDIFEELLGRELNYIFERSGCRNDRAAVDQLRKAWSVELRQYIINH